MANTDQSIIRLLKQMREGSRVCWHSPKISSHSFDNEINDSILAIIYAYVFQFILLAVKIHDS
ncbi:MAG: hypothetical protein LHW51_00390, partial [Candidatus Cloacimonetes bacterium]|nr:hypothetical protein [Candidatus Cloacimonadota bacterium]MCK9179200.1 hypothetical protein [Candidatus Cloacimonadota bacterium]MCK9242025.1 hypothetical protein [Candidatus Cloacimonadota bacterium]